MNKDRLQLPKGVTGFWRQGDIPVPAVDVEAFKNLCQDVATKLGGAAHEVAQTSICNFNAITITYGDKGVMVVCNAHAPLIALTNGPFDGGLDFVDNEEIANALSTSEFRLLSAGELRVPLDQLDLTQLGEVEIDQITHWKPGTAGELIFNYWD